ncbi:MAG: undecaprenyl-phosphate galactose phosphotransferase WbaP [Spirochaetaceae bacterium]|jgi:Undecaprenyl-phosphate galactose phosphotransferase WbaP|nr:undecaprenyl-phosphate galactose phosphotransferase WbaP [Spirochaetaceae bacterium]
MQAEDGEFRILKRNASSFCSGMMLLFVDALAIMLCFGASFFIINLIDHSLINFRSFITYWVYLPVFLLVFYGAKLYPGIMLPPADEVRRVSLCSLCLFAGIALSIEVETDDRTALSIALILSIPIAIILIPAMREIARLFCARFSWWGVGVIVYCKGKEGQKVIDHLLNKPDLGYRPVLIVDTDINYDLSAEHQNEVQQELIPQNEIYQNEVYQREYRGIPTAPPSLKTHTYIKKYGYKAAIIVESRDNDINKSGLGDTITRLYRYTILIPYTQMSTIALSIRDLGGILGFASTHNLTKRGNLIIKRITDVIICVIFSPFILALTAVIAVMVKLSSPGPVFYGHKRSGKNGREFKAWKFRSMVQNADSLIQDMLEKDPQARAEWEAKQKLDNDPRITRLGKFLRATSLDEIPQLWNIFTGEMSLAGPRPVTKEELTKYGKYAEYVFSVTPGLSGLWQVSGRSETSYEERITLDSYYIQNWSIWLDIWILLKTAGAVIRKKGAV